MKKIVYKSLRPEDTFALGREIGEKTQPGTVFTLIGDLGVGKTVFTQGMAAGLGITEPVNSPTFTILQIYEEGRCPFYHFDVYRIGDISEMDEIGYEDCFYGEGVCLIECIPSSRFAGQWLRASWYMCCLRFLKRTI